MGYSQNGCFGNNTAHEGVMIPKIETPIDVEDLIQSPIVREVETPEHRALVKLKKFANSTDYKIIEVVLTLIIGIGLIIAILLEMIKRSGKPRRPK